MAYKTYKGKYRVLNEEKYKGDKTNVIYRSQWEYQALKFLDKNKNVKWFNSEEVVIPYKSPIDGKMHRYFVDLAFENMNGDVVLIEIKPYGQTQKPKPQKRKTRQYLNKVKTYLINRAKWNAAEYWCKKRGYKFRIWTERELRKFGLTI